MNDQDMSAIVDRATKSIHQALSYSEANRDYIAQLMKQSRYDEAQSRAGLDNVEIMNLLVTQIEIQAATLDVLIDIRAALQER